MLPALSKLRFLTKLFPFTIKDDTFLRDYLHQTDRIAVHHDRRKIRQFHLIYALMMIGAGNFLYLGIAPCLTLRARLLHYDMVYLVYQQKFIIHIMAAFVIATVAYSSWQFYFRPARQNNRLFETLVLRQRSGCFFLFDRKGICHRIRRKLFSIARLIHLFPLSINVLLLLTHFIIFYKCHRYFSASEPVLYYYGALMLCTIAGLVTFDSVLYFYCYFIWIIVTVASIQLYVLILKLSQLNRYLRQSPTKWIHYREYHSHLIRVLEYFVEYNRLYGELFCAFLLVNCPLSAFLIIQLILNPNNVSLLATTYFYTYSVVEYVCLFALHYHLVRFSTHFHGSANRLQSLMVAVQFSDIRNRLRLAELTMAVNSKEKYGITYGKFGLVTLNTFAKVIIGLSTYNTSSLAVYFW